MPSPVADAYSVASGSVIHAGRYGSEWVPAVGTIADVSLNTLDAVRGGDSQAQTNAVMNSWNGQVYAPSYGQYGSIISYGGGHTDSPLNAVYRYDIASRTHSKIKPSAPNYISSGTGAATGSGSTGWMWGDAGQTTEQIGEPIAGHHYATLVWVPGSALPGQGADAGWLFQAGLGTVSWNAGAHGACHKLRLGADVKWSSAGAAIRPAIYGGSCYDSKRKRVINIDYNTVTDWRWLDIASGSVGATGFYRGGAYPQLTGYYHCVFYDAASDLYYAVHTDSPYELHVIDPVTGWVREPAQTGSNPAGLQGGWEWVEAWGALVFKPGSGNVVWTLKRPADPMLGTWTWASQTLSGSGRASNGVQHYTRFRYVPAIDCFLWSSTTQVPVQAFRLAAP